MTEFDETLAKLVRLLAARAPGVTGVVKLEVHLNQGVLADVYIDTHEKRRLKGVIAAA